MSVHVRLHCGPFDGAEFDLPGHPASITFFAQGDVAAATYAVDGPFAELYEQVIDLYDERHHRSLTVDDLADDGLIIVSNEDGVCYETARLTSPTWPNGIGLLGQRVCLVYRKDGTLDRVVIGRIVGPRLLVEKFLAGETKLAIIPVGEGGDGPETVVGPVRIADPGIAIEKSCMLCREELVFRPI
jgi:hypothetical protein